MGQTKTYRLILQVRQHENYKKWVGGGMIVEYIKNSLLLCGSGTTELHCQDLVYSLCRSGTLELHVKVYSLFGSGIVELQVKYFPCAEVELQVTIIFLVRKRNFR